MVGPPQTAHQNNYTNLHGYSLSHEFVIIVMSSLQWSHHKTLQYISDFLLAVFPKTTFAKPQ